MFHPTLQAELARLRAEDLRDRTPRPPRRRRSHMAFALVALGVLAVALLAHPAPSHAGTVDVAADGVRFTAAPGEANALKIISGSPLLIRDDVPLTLTSAAQAVCTVGGDPGLAVCDANAPFTIDLGDGDDVVLGSALGDRIAGGDGNDVIEGGEGADAIDGGGGDDTLFGQEDRLSFTGDAADAIGGGPGTDTVIYRRTSQPLRVTLDGQGDDGAAGEGDDVGVDVENVTTGSGEDVLVGNDEANVLDGGFGSDVIRGGGGPDTVISGGGDGQLFGEDGDDQLIGSAGSERFDGGAGLDRFVVDPVSCDALGCGFGNDEVYARDGVAEQIDCSLGADKAVVDRVDIVVGCEQVDRGPEPGPAPALRCGFSVPKRMRVAALLRGPAAMVTCSAAASLRATLTVGRRTARRARLGRGARTIAVGTAALDAAGTARIDLRPDARARRKLRGLRRVRARVTVTAASAGQLVRGATWIEGRR